MLVIAWLLPEGSIQSYYCTDHLWHPEQALVLKFRNISEILDCVTRHPEAFKNAREGYRILRLTEKITYAEEVVLE